MREVERELDVMSQRGNALRRPLEVWWATLLRAARALERGEFAESEILAAKSFEVGARINAAEAQERFAALQFILAWLRGGLEEIEPSTKQYVATSGDRRWRGGLALVYAELDRREEARFQFEALLSEGLDFVRDMTRSVVLALLAETCIYLGDAERAEALYRALEPHDGRLMVLGTGIQHIGPAAHYLGGLAATMGSFDRALVHFEDALALNDRAHARPFAARTQVALAELLLRAGQAGEQRAEQLLRAALGTAEALGMKAVERRARLRLDSRATSAVRCGPRLATSRADGAQLFRKEGDFWTVHYAGTTCRLRHTRGLVFLAQLLRQPGTPIHVLDLVDQPSSGARAGSIARARSDAGEHLDPQAKDAYRRRLRDLAGEIERARDDNDLGRVAALEREIDFVSAELTRAFGLNGSIRRAGSHAERARVNVRRAVGLALRRIHENHPELSRHLATTIHTGTFCSYSPDERVPIVWEL